MFQLASLSKPLGSTVIAHQVGRKAVGWSTRGGQAAVVRPVRSGRDQVLTIGDLYSRTGPGCPTTPVTSWRIWATTAASSWSAAPLPLAPFRISYAYTNFGVTAAAEAVATAAAGTSWEDLSEQVLYRPLGMASTSSRFADYEARADKALGHIRTGDGYRPLFGATPTRSHPPGE